jgi:hypothetical protein
MIIQQQLLNFTKRGLSQTIARNVMRIVNCVPTVPELVWIKMSIIPRNKVMKIMLSAKSI